MAELGRLLIYEASRDCMVSFILWIYDVLFSSNNNGMYAVRNSSFGEANKKSDNIRIIDLYGQVVIC